jgi:hypothetical protein
MRGVRCGLGHLVAEPRLPFPWQPAPPPELLARVPAGLERLRAYADVLAP